MIIIFGQNFALCVVREYIDSIVYQFKKRNIQTECIAFNTEQEINQYIVNKSIKNSLIIYLQVFSKQSPIENNNKEFLLNIEQAVELSHRKSFVENVLLN